MSKTNSYGGRSMLRPYVVVVGAAGWLLAFILLAGMVSAQSPVTLNANISKKIKQLCTF